VSSVIAAVSLFTSCDDTISGIEQDATELKTTASERAKQVGQAAEVELVDFKRSANEGLTSVDAKISEIERRMDDASEEAKAEARTQLEELQQERSALAKRIADASASADTEWEATKRALGESIAKLGRDADEVLDELGNDIRKAAE
jgi:hypothetical protein